MGRLKDSLDAILGRLPTQRMAVIEVEWAALQLEVANMMEQVGRWAGRQSKAAARQVKKLEAEEEATQLKLPAPEIAPTHKQELRRRVTAMRLGGQPESPAKEA